MTSYFEDLSDTRKKFTVEISPSEMESERSAALKVFCTQASLPGFRAGKAPEAMVSKRFAKQIQEEVQRVVLRKAYEQALKDQNADVYQVIEVNDAALSGSTDAPVEVSFVVDLKPQVTLPSYKGLVVKVKDTTPTQAQIDGEVAEALDREAVYNRVEDRSSVAGDFVQFSFTGSDDSGKPLAESMPGMAFLTGISATWERAGGTEESLIKEICDALVGVKKGDSLSVDSVLVSPRVPEAFRGKSVRYAVEVLDVREKKLPELNEVFLSAKGFAGKDEFYAFHKNKVLERNLREQNESKYSQAAAQLLANNAFPVPDSAVQAESNDALNERINRALQQGVPMEYLQQNLESMATEFQPIAKDQVRLKFILLEVAKKESLKVGPSDLEAQIRMTVARENSTPEKVIKRFKKEEGFRNYISVRAACAKALDFIVSHCIVETEAVQV